VLTHTTPKGYGPDDPRGPENKGAAAPSPTGPVQIKTADGWAVCTAPRWQGPKAPSLPQQGQSLADKALLWALTVKDYGTDNTTAVKRALGAVKPPKKPFRFLPEYFQSAKAPISLTLVKPAPWPLSFLQALQWLTGKRRARIQRRGRYQFARVFHENAA